MDAIVINLDRSEDRWHFQQGQLGALGLGFTRLAATEGASLDEALYRSTAYRWRRPMSRNEVACLMSHQAAWRSVCSAGRPTLVLEDDAVVSPYLPQVLESLPTADEPLVFNLETCVQPKRLHAARWAELSRGFGLYRLVRDRGGSAAYVVTPEAAEAFLERSQRAVGLADALMADVAVVTRYQVEPAPCVQLQFVPHGSSAAKSTIGPGSGRWQSDIPMREVFAMKGRRLLAAMRAMRRWALETELTERRQVPACPTLGARLCA